MFFGNRTVHHAHGADIRRGVAVFRDFFAVFVEELQGGQAVGFVGAMDFPVADGGFVGGRVDEAFLFHLRHGFSIAESNQSTVFLDAVFINRHFDIAVGNRADVVPVAADAAACGRSRLTGAQEQGCR